MELTLNVSPNFLKKAKALRALTDADNMDSVITDLLDRAADQAIVEALAALDSGAESLEVRSQPARKSVEKPVKKAPYIPPKDVTDISDGLGDDDVDEEVDASGAVSSEDLDHDMDLDDPDTEAAADASDLDIFGGSAEDIFAEAAGLPPPPAQPAGSSRNERAVRRRELKKKVLPPRKARVSNFETSEESSF